MLLNIDMERWRSDMTLYLRDQWGSTGERGGYDLPGPVSEAYVHHFGSGIQPARSVDEAMARMRSAQAYHRSLGWGDIGYSWCVDFAGNVYEGRGWNRTGAHTYGYNSKGYGVCGLFDSTVFPPSDEMIAGVAWAIRQGVELGKITARPTIVGHRDRVPDTACCGDPMYLRLDDIRALVYEEPATDGGTNEEQFMLQHFLRVTEGELKDTVYARYTTGALVPIAPEEFDTDGGKVPVKNTTTEGLRMALKVG